MIYIFLYRFSHMRVRVVQSADADWDLSDKIREALEGKITPLELDFVTVKRFYQTVGAVDSSADVNIVLLFPRKEEAAIAAIVLDRLQSAGTKVIFYFADELGTYEDDILEMVQSAAGL